ncbi:hypothetical protein EJ04DRAFT_452917, partial [Polyplosphaeria fusca]
ATFFNATAEEVAVNGFSIVDSVKVQNGGYVAVLGVYHQLHCLNQIRNFLYLRASGATDKPLSDEQLGNNHHHIEHCIEDLRVSAMCTADLRLYTFTWPKEENFTFLDAHTNTPRKCVDWTQLEQWSLRRKISLTPTLIVPDNKK